MRRKEDMVELSLRLPSDGWKDLTALLMALLGGVPTASDRVQPKVGEENAAFDEVLYRRLSGMEEEMLPAVQRQMSVEERAGEPWQRAAEGVEEQNVPRYRVEGSVDAPLSVPAPANYGGMEGMEAASGRREDTDSPDAAEQKNEAENWERRWERDCRRYDSGFPLR